MEFLVASAIGVLTAGGVYLILRLRTFPVILGISLLSYAVNVFLFATGRLAVDAPPVLQKYADVAYTDPLPQALVLTAIVISFGMTAVLVMFALGAYLEADHDQINIQDADEIESSDEKGQGA
ncbi:Na+/H+ antiporter subunit C [Shimia haliotis]|uniref:Multisubunit potassium/proton antiporter, PhaC subunit n=1 Tax=Shimia haliotis TaxID=1280847 RepID=A0A1I4F122_9RHOB|nr:Na+/H+ antiporter subunit C [Shimia haliotis]SFL10517.1 multisubunit potassium/proton antiporter, PhaC subunit [Shimia haliotis]